MHSAADLIEVNLIIQNNEGYFINFACLRIYLDSCNVIDVPYENLLQTIA